MPLFDDCCVAYCTLYNGCVAAGCLRFLSCYVGDCAVLPVGEGKKGRAAEALLRALRKVLPACVHPRNVLSR
eukprot:scaffold305672_cov22-Tisochrysis_lutea.AAC.1